MTPKSAQSISLDAVYDHIMVCNYFQLLMLSRVIKLTEMYTRGGIIHPQNGNKNRRMEVYTSTAQTWSAQQKRCNKAIMVV